jgi:hypothetical protein
MKVAQARLDLARYMVAYASKLERCTDPRRSGIQLDWPARYRWLVADQPKNFRMYQQRKVVGGVVGGGDACG